MKIPLWNIPNCRDAFSPNRKIWKLWIEKRRGGLQQEWYLEDKMNGTHSLENEQAARKSSFIPLIDSTINIDERIYWMLERIHVVLCKGQMKDCLRKFNEYKKGPSTIN